MGFSHCMAGSINHVARKSAHFTEYAILGLLAFLTALMCWPRAYFYRGPFLVTIMCCLYAVSGEAHQAFVPSRTETVKQVNGEASAERINDDVFHGRWRHPGV